MTEVGYDGDGRLVDARSKECVAKIVTGDSGRVAHCVRRAAAGVSVGRLFNPSEPVYQLGAARTKWEWASVPEENFRCYLRFLETRETKHLRNAERAL
jgi:hypothetical protein